MRIALVGKFDGPNWRAEGFVQRALWQLGHEVYGIRRCEPPVEPNWAEIDEVADEGVTRADYEESLRAWRSQLDGITDVDLTLVLQGYGLPISALAEVKLRTQRPLVLWHGEVIGSIWPTSDEVVQGKVAALTETLAVYDLVAHNCRTSLDLLTQFGAKRVSCVPVNGVEAGYHRRMPEVPKQLDVLIYGWVSSRRYDVVTAVAAQLPQGTRYAWADPSQGYYGEALMELINRAKIVLNVHYNPTPNTETRLYEALGCGVPVVSEPISMPELFPSGCGVLYGEMPEDLAAQVRRILGMDRSEYLGLADAGYELVHQRYSYQARCAQLLEVVAKECG